MRNSEQIHSFRSEKLVERLLAVCGITAFDQATVTVYYLPPLLENPIGGIVRRCEIQFSADDPVAEQNVTDIIRELIVEEVHIRPLQIRIDRPYPIVIGQTQPHRANHERADIIDVQIEQQIVDSRTSRGNSPAFPPFPQCFRVNKSLGNGS